MLNCTFIKSSRHNSICISFKIKYISSSNLIKRRVNCKLIISCTSHLKILKIKNSNPRISQNVFKPLEPRYRVIVHSHELQVGPRQALACLPAIFMVSCFLSAPIFINSELVSLTDVLVSIKEAML